MRLYIVRHAIAVAVGEEGVEHDADRHLNAQGVKQGRRLAYLFARLGEPLNQVWTSPLVRARQTAELLVCRLPTPPPLVTCEALVPPGDGNRLCRELAESSLEGVALVGHEPFLGNLLYGLVGGGGRGSLEMAKGAVACVLLERGDPPVTRLLWLLTPKLIKCLKG